MLGGSGLAVSNDPLTDIAVVYGLKAVVYVEPTNE
jgi:hypothetical protein